MGLCCPPPLTLRIILEMHSGPLALGATYLASHETKKRRYTRLRSCFGFGYTRLYDLSEQCQPFFITSKNRVVED